MSPTVRYSSDCSVDDDCLGNSKCLPLVIGEKTILHRCSSNIPSVCYDQMGTCPPSDSIVPLLTCMPSPHEALQTKYVCGALTKYLLQPGIITGCSVKENKVCSNHGTCTILTGSESSSSSSSASSISTKRMLMEGTNVTSVVNESSTNESGNSSARMTSLAPSNSTTTTTTTTTPSATTPTPKTTTTLTSLLPDMIITSAQCNCYAGYGGKDCSQVISKNCEYECTYGNGQCINNQCYCGKQYKGQQCELSNAITKGNCGTDGWFDDAKNACVCRYGKKDGTLCTKQSCTDCSASITLSFNRGIMITLSLFVIGFIF